MPVEKPKYVIELAQWLIERGVSPKDAEEIVENAAARVYQREFSTTHEHSEGE